MQSEHKITLQFQNDLVYKCRVLRTSHFYQSRENLKSYFVNDPAVCYCMLLLLNATSFENSFFTTKELIYSMFDEERYACET
jgi:hypothetical protein